MVTIRAAHVKGIERVIAQRKIEHLILDVDHDEDGYWVYIAQRGWSDDMDCRTLHEDTVAAIVDKLRSVRTLTDAEMTMQKHR